MGILRSLSRGHGSSCTNLGIPRIVMRRNWQNVIRDPDCGYIETSCSNARALLGERRVGILWMNNVFGARKLRSTHLQQPPKTRESVTLQS